MCVYVCACERVYVFRGMNVHVCECIYVWVGVSLSV